MKDELAAHQLELVKREEDMLTLNEKCKRLQEENNELIDRWMLLKEQEILKLNQVNEFVEEYVY